MDTVLYRRQADIGILELNRPKELNALNMEMLGDLYREIGEIGFDRTVRCVIITGVGEKAFAAGADIAEMEDMSFEKAKELARFGCKVFQAIEDIAIPVVAAINGYALGGGLELALACDIRLMSRTAQIGLPETSIGIMPGWGGTRRLQQVAGYATAAEMIFTAGKMDAEYALAHGIVSGVCDGKELMGRALALTEKICKNAPCGVQNAKRAMRKVNMDEVENLNFAQLFLTKDQRAGMDRFIRRQKAERYVGE